MPKRSHNAVIGSSPPRYSAMNASFSSTTQVSFHGIGKGPPLPTKKTCQASIRSILSDMYPDRTDRAPPPPRPSPVQGEGDLIGVWPPTVPPPPLRGGGRGGVGPPLRRTPREDTHDPT